MKTPYENKKKWPLRAHQEETVRFLSGKKAAAVLSQQGTGKTRSVLEYLDRRADVLGPERIIVVAPNTIVGVWVHEIQKWSEHYHDKVWAMTGTRQKRIKMAQSSRPGIFVINYEGVRALRKHINLAKLNWAVVIADEMSRIKTPSAQQSKAMHDFPKHSKAIRIGLSGTPITNSPLDAFSEYKFIEPRLFGQNFMQFRYRYAELQEKFFGGRRFKDVVGFKNLDELTRKIYSISIRHEKKHCLEIPPKTYQRIVLPWQPKQKAAYDTMAESLIAEIGGKVVAVPNVLSKLAKLRQICGGWAYTGDGGATHFPSNPKAQAVVDLLEDASAPTVIWCDFVEDVRLLRKTLDKNKISHLSITGDLDLDERQRNAERFQKGNVAAVICQLAVAQYGITLTAAESAIFFSQSWSVEQREQAEDRIHRLGQEKKTTYYDLVMEESVDVAIAESLKKKSKLASKIVGKDFEALVRGESVADQLHP